jgi:hypothetical protein
MRQLVVLIGLAIILGGCGAASVTGQYVADDKPRSIMTLDLVQTDAVVRGSLDLVMPDIGRAEHKVTSVTGVRDGQTIILRSDQVAGASVAFSGAIDGDTIALSVPDNMGSVQRFFLKRAPREKLEQLVNVWNDELSTSPRCTVGVNGHDAEITYLGANARGYCLGLVAMECPQCRYESRERRRDAMSRVCRRATGDFVMEVRDTGGFRFGRIMCDVGSNVRPR